MKGATLDRPSDSFVFATADSETFDARYHVPRSQVWEGSRGGQRGNVHLHVRAEFKLGRIRRKPGEALCGRRSWFPRALHQDEIATPCPRCAEIAGRLL